MKAGLGIAIAVVLSALIFRLTSEVKRVDRSKVTSWTEGHRADCAVVLTGGPGRIREGFNLLSQKRVKKLIISGVHPSSHLREIFPEWPIYGKLNVDDVILEKRSGTTYGNAQQSLVLVEALHCRDLVLITSKLHMYRAQKTFESVFPQGFPISYRSTLFGPLDTSYTERTIEAIKSIFYSLWVY